VEVRPEWVEPVPDGWEERLRRISPIVDRVSHLRFRYRADKGVWMLYECIPAHLLDPFRVEQLTVHWSDLALSSQMGRRQFVSEYQHYMFRTHKVDARPFWVLQGPTGGTPAVFSHREQRLLQAVGAPDDPPPVGFLPPCVFDEQAVDAVVQRDLLYKIGGDLDTLANSRTVEALTADDEQTEREYRRAFLSWWFDACLPMSDFMQAYLRSTEADRTLRRATNEENNALAQWKEHFLETGDVLRAETLASGNARVQMPVL
jgi:hypothetical protein